jgi:hypothetical protein
MCVLRNIAPPRIMVKGVIKDESTCLLLRTIERRMIVGDKVMPPGGVAAATMTSLLLTSFL